MTVLPETGGCGRADGTHRSAETESNAVRNRCSSRSRAREGFFAMLMAALVRPPDLVDRFPLGPLWRRARRLIILRPMLDQAEERRLTGQQPSQPFTRLPGNLSKGCIILCDHASNRMPASYGTLGLSPNELSRHIAFDIGAAGVTRYLSELLGAPAVMANFSRLLIDPNRGDDDPTLVMRLSDGAIVPGNAEIDEAEVERRKTNFYQPYHDAVDALIDEELAVGTIPVLVSIHSFTARFRDRARPWHVAVLWDKDDRLPVPLIEQLRCEPDVIVGENEPYSGELKGDCLYRHGTKRGLAHALIELRQDLIGEVSGQRAWADRLARVLSDLLDRPTLASKLHQTRYYGSNTEKASAGQMEEQRDD